MSFVVYNHVNNIYVLYDKSVGPVKKSKLLNVVLTTIPESIEGINDKSYKLKIRLDDINGEYFILTCLFT